MTPNEFLTEDDLSTSDFVKSTNREKYLANFIAAVNSKTPLPLGSEAAKKIGKSALVLHPDSITILKRIIKTGKLENLKADGGMPIKLSSIEKSSLITGRVKPNMGYVGEISLGVAIAARFLKLGQQITYADFI